MLFKAVMLCNTKVLCWEHFCSCSYGKMRTEQVWDRKQEQHRADLPFASWLAEFSFWEPCGQIAVNGENPCIEGNIMSVCGAIPMTFPPIPMRNWKMFLSIVMAENEFGRPLPSGSRWKRTGEKEGKEANFPAPTVDTTAFMGEIEKFLQRQIDKAKLKK